MKIIYAAFLLSLAAICGYSQISEQPRLIVLEKKWDFELQNPALDESVYLESDARFRVEQEQRNSTVENQRRTLTGDNIKDAGPAPPNQRFVRRKRSKFTPVYTYQIKVKNLSEKSLRAVILEYVFLEPNTEREVGRRQFTGGKKISSGKTKEFVFRSKMPPTGTINADEIDKKLIYKEKIIIRKIEYADGSVWQEDNAK